MLVRIPKAAPPIRSPRAVGAAAEDSAPVIVVVARADPVVAEIVAELQRAEYLPEIVAPETLEVYRALSLCPDLIVLDLDALGATGMEVLHSIHRLFPLLPVLLMSADTDETKLVQALAAGADDLLSRPISPVAMVARVGAVLRRSLPLQRRRPVLSAGPLVVDERSRRAEVFGIDTRLTQTEFNLLVFMMRNARRVLPRDVLLERVWGYRFGEPSTVTVHVRRLRTKLEPDPANPIAIKTVWGAGYLFDPAGPPGWPRFDPNIRRPRASPG